MLTRVDFNVAMDGAHIGDDTRIRLTLPTIAALRSAGARVVLISHFKEGKPRQTLAPIAARLQELFGGPVTFLRDRVGSTGLAKALGAVRRGDVAMLENLRHAKGEEENDIAFARALAQLGEVYVNDAFSVCHRRHASVATVPMLLSSAAGPLLEREVDVFSKLLDGPAVPFVALLGGAKISTKIPVIDRLRMVADTVLLGGALVNNFFAARGYGVGDSLIEEEGVVIAKRLLRSTKHRNCTLPIDVVIGDPSGKRKDVRVVPVQSKPHVLCEAPFAVLDIGPATMRAYSQQLKSAATIVWNGPMGMFERPPFHHGSMTLARVIASRSSGRAFGVVGGGETLALLAATKMERYIDHVSSGGGAMLSFLAGDELPGIVPLVKH